MQSRMAVKQTRDHYSQNNGEKKRRVFKWVMMDECTSGKWHIWVLISLTWGGGGCCYGKIFLFLDVTAWWIENDFVMTQDTLWFSKTSSSRPRIILCSNVNCSILCFSVPGRLKETVLALAYILLSLLASRALYHWRHDVRCLSTTPYLSRSSFKNHILRN